MLQNKCLGGIYHRQRYRTGQLSPGRYVAGDSVAIKKRRYVRLPASTGNRAIQRRADFDPGRFTVPGAV